jgi:hypothetical protein
MPREVERVVTVVFPLVNTFTETGWGTRIVTLPEWVDALSATNAFVDRTPWRCKVCGTRWEMWPDGTFSTRGTPRPCCDNATTDDLERVVDVMAR